MQFKRHCYKKRKITNFKIINLIINKLLYVKIDKYIPQLINTIILNLIVKLRFSFYVLRHLCTRDAVVHTFSNRNVFEAIHHLKGLLIIYSIVLVSVSGNGDKYVTITNNILVC